MDVLWTAGRPVTVRQALDALNARRTSPFAYTTVLTVMTRLAEKGALTRTPHGRGHLYAPSVTDEAALAVRNVIRTYGDAALSRFVDQAASNPDLRKRLQALLEPAAGTGQQSPGASP